jgi:glycosyltransferase involved in cell wall biosynthesis
VIDIHENYQSVVRRRDWIPALLRWPLQAVIVLNQWLGRRLAAACLVAAAHLARPGDVLVTNLPPVGMLPVDRSHQTQRAVYVGDVTKDRGLDDMLELISLVPHLELDLIGPISSELREEVTGRAMGSGIVDRLRVRGRLPYLSAWEEAAGSLVGLSLLRPTPAYREAVPSKLWEYFACRIPVIATDLPAQARIVAESGGGWVVKGGAEAASLLGEVLDDPAQAMTRGEAGYLYYLEVASRDQSAASLVKAISGP